MSYQENIEQLAQRFPFVEDNLGYVRACGEYYRFGVIFHEEEKDIYWLGVYESQSDAIDYAEMTVREPTSKWDPVFLVDFLDLQSFEMNIEVRIGISTVSEIGYEPS